MAVVLTGTDPEITALAVLIAGEIADALQVEYDDFHSESGFDGQTLARINAAVEELLPAALIANKTA